MWVWNVCVEHSGEERDAGRNGFLPCRCDFKSHTSRKSNKETDVSRSGGWAGPVHVTRDAESEMGNGGPKTRVVNVTHITSLLPLPPRGRHLSTKRALSWDLQIQVLLQKRETAKNEDHRKLLQRKELNDWKKKKRKKKTKTKTIEKRKKNQEKESDQKRKQKEKNTKQKKSECCWPITFFIFFKKIKILNV